MSARVLVVLAAAAIAGAAAWPAFVATREAQASGPTPAPVLADYAHRDRLVSFYEGAVRKNPDQIVTRMLASQYLQRFRENSDAADLARGEHAARKSLALQPQFNAGAEMTLASALVSQHRFREALAHAQRALEIDPGNPAAIAQVSSTDVELGRYADARRLLTSTSAARGFDVGLGTAQARYDEVTGNLESARRTIDLAMMQTDGIIDSPAESRAWFHVRAGELAWTSGDTAAAERRFREALAIFPQYSRALNGLARLYWSERRWPDALDAAKRAADRVPLPETLGYEADAQRALGDGTAARKTEDMIGAIARVGNANGVYDRALSIYFAEHGIRLDDAVRSRGVTSRRATTCSRKTRWPGRSRGRAGGRRRASRRAKQRAGTRKTHAYSITRPSSR